MDADRNRFTPPLPASRRFLTESREKRTGTTRFVRKEAATLRRTRLRFLAMSSRQTPAICLWPY